MHIPKIPHSDSSTETTTTTKNKSTKEEKKGGIATYSAPGKSGKLQDLFTKMSFIKQKTSEIKSRDTIRSRVSLSGKKECSRAAEATRSVKSPLPPKKETSETMQVGKQREDKAQNKFSTSRNSLQISSTKLKEATVQDRNAIGQSLGKADLTNFKKIDIARFTITIDRLLGLADGTPSLEGLQVVQVLLHQIGDHLSPTLKLHLSNAINEAESGIAKQDKQALVSAAKKMVPVPKSSPFQQEASFIPSAVYQSLSQEAVKLNDFSSDDDKEVDALLGNLIEGDSPELDDLKELTQEIEKEFSPPVDNQKNKGRPLSQFVRRNLRNSTKAENADTKKFFKEHNKMAKASDAAKLAINAAPEKNAIVSDDKVYQELDELVKDLAYDVATPEKKMSEDKSGTANVDDDFDNALNELEQILEKKPDPT